MKKILRSVCICLATLACCLCFVGCGNDKVEANFVRFSIGQRQSDYYLDFTIKFYNKTNHDETLLASDFYVEINDEKNESISFWYDGVETYYAYPTIKSNESLTLRLRVTANVKNKDYNKIVVKFHDKVLVDDNVFISNNQSVG